LAGLGPLQVEVLLLAWEGAPEGASVRDLYEQLRAERPIAYTTVMTELHNLTVKGLLVCDSSETVYRYRPAIAPRQVAGAVLDAVVRALYRGQAAPAVAHLLDLGSLDEAQLAELRSEAERL
jgi:predicted transcriptional regulator